MKMMLELSHDDIQRQIPYAVICETRYGRAWETGKRRRRWLAEFSEQERKAASKLFSQAHQWYLRTGVPEKIVMSTSTYALWQKLGAFCGTI